MKTLSLEYLSGFFDGEGHIAIIRQNRKDCPTPILYLDVGVTNTVKGIVERFQDLFGGYVATQRFEQSHRKTVYHWHITARKAKKVLEVLLPHIILQKERAILALEFQSYKAPKVYGKPIIKRKRQEEIYWLLRRRRLRNALYQTTSTGKPATIIGTDRREAI